MRTKTLCLFFLVIVTAALASGQAVTRCGGPTPTLYINWPTFQFDDCHTGYNPYEYRINSANVQDLVVEWQYGPGPGPLPFSSLVLANGVVYFGSGGGTIEYAVDAGTGALLWTYDTYSRLRNPCYTCTDYPAVFNNILYVGFGQSMYALDAKAGTLLWKYDTSGGANIVNGAAVADGLVYIGSYDGNSYTYTIYALDAKTGALRWQRTPGASSTPTVVNGLVYSAVGSDLYALNAVSGAVVWHASLGGGISTDGVTVFNNVVYASTNNDLSALNALTGAVLWKALPPTHTTFQSAPVVGAGAVYVGAARNNPFTGPLVYSFDATNGSLLWSSLGDGYGWIYYLALANGVLYADGGPGVDHLSALSPADGSILWQYQNVSETAPIIANGKVYIPTCCTNNYYLYAFHLPNQ